MFILFLVLFCFSTMSTFLSLEMYWLEVKYIPSYYYDCYYLTPPWSRFIGFLDFFTFNFDALEQPDFYSPSSRGWWGGWQGSGQPWVGRSLLYDFSPVFYNSCGLIFLMLQAVSSGRSPDVSGSFLSCSWLSAIGTCLSFWTSVAALKPHQSVQAPSRLFHIGPVTSTSNLF